MCNHSFMRFFAALSLGFLAVAAAPRASATDAGAPACVAIRTESRWVPYGYNHIVILTNGCARDATCSVSTDVNPEPTTVDVPRSATVEVLTFRASPASAFVPRVACALR